MERITRRVDLWERGLHAGLVGGVEAEGSDRDGSSASEGEEEEDVLRRKFHITVLYGKLCQAIFWATDREGGGCLRS